MKPQIAPVSWFMNNIYTFDAENDQLCSIEQLLDDSINVLHVSADVAETCLTHASLHRYDDIIPYSVHGDVNQYLH
jgi:hypothetical protein